MKNTNSNKPANKGNRASRLISFCVTEYLKNIKDFNIGLAAFTK